MKNRNFVCVLPGCLLLLVATSVLPCPVRAEEPAKKWDQEDKFRQLEQDLPTPNGYRTASGAPGKEYWQQQADYEINVEMDDEKRRIIGSETITYSNRSPDPLSYLWLQLEPNIFKPDSDANLTQTAPTLDRVSFEAMQNMLAREVFDGGVNIRSVKDATQQDLKYTIIKTMMRVDLPKPLEPGESTKCSLLWGSKIAPTTS